MSQTNRQALARPSWLVGYSAAFGAVTLVSLFIGFVVGRINLANVSMLYLFAVLATAVAFGRGAAIFAAIAAFLLFDWLFVQPLHQLNVSDPEECRRGRHRIDGVSGPRSWQVLNAW